MRQTIENGRAVERMMAATGPDLILLLRKGVDALFDGLAFAIPVLPDGSLTVLTR